MVVQQFLLAVSGAFVAMVQCLAKVLPTASEHPAIPAHRSYLSLQHSMQLLLVDDEQEICLLLNAMLMRYGARNTMAHSLADGREKLRSNGPFTGVFLDVNLPDGKGYDLIPSIREHSPEARVIVISAMDQERVHAIKAGADLFLAKPLDRNSILEGLRKVHLLDPEKEPN